MDRYTKAVLTVIAISLAFIAVKLWEPKEAHTGVLSGGPVLGDYRNAAGEKNPEKQREAIEKLVNSIPIVYVHHIRGGNIEVSGSVQIDN